MGWEQKFAEEANGEAELRGERNADAYIPTFFTDPRNHQQLTQATQAQIPADPNIQQRQLYQQSPTIYYKVHRQ